MLDKKELIDEIAAVNDITKVRSEESLDHFVSGIASAIINHGGARIRGFGTFEIVDRAARIGRNPATGEKVDIPAYKEIVFSAGKQLKEELKIREQLWKN